MGQVSIRFTDKQEIDLRKKAQANKQSLAEYLRGRVLGDEAEEMPLCRVTIESQIEQLEKKVNRLSKIMMDLSRENIGEIHMNSNLVMGFFDAVIDDDEIKQKIYKAAKAETKEYLAKVFGEEKKK